jgi:hypothetical protein
MLDELRHSTRALRRSPTLTLAAICTLAIAIGASTAVFSVIDKVLVRPLPIDSPERIAVIWSRERLTSGSIGEFSYVTFRSWQRELRAFESLAAVGSVNWSLILREGEPSTVPVAAVSASFFPLMGTAAARGRTPTAIVENVTTMEQIVGRAMAPWRFSALTLALLGGLALVLAASGVCAVTSQFVIERTREIGVRVAVGARPRHVAGLFLRDGLRLTAMGVAIGVTVSVGTAQALTSLLYDVPPVDPLTLGGHGGALHGRQHRRNPASRVACLTNQPDRCAARGVTGRAT